MELQKKYIDSVDGNAHMSAVEIIGWKENAVNTVVIDKKNGRDGFVYGYTCPACRQIVQYDEHLSEYTILFICAFCGGRLMVGGVNFNDSVSDPEPFILPAGWDREE